MDQKALGQFVQSASGERWLYPEELYLILSSDPIRLGFVVSVSPPVDPKNGSLFLFMDSRQIKADGINWVKKKGQDRIQEAYFDVKINSKEAIKGVYCKCADNLNFKRRIYRLIDTRQSSLWLSHYRECQGDERPEKYTLNPIVLQCWNDMVAGTGGFSGLGSTTVAPPQSSPSQPIIHTQPRPQFIPSSIPLQLPESALPGLCSDQQSQFSASSMRESSHYSVADDDFDEEIWDDLLMDCGDGDETCAGGSERGVTASTQFTTTACSEIGGERGGERQACQQQQQQQQHFSWSDTRQRQQLPPPLHPQQQVNRSPAQQHHFHQSQPHATTLLQQQQQLFQPVPSVVVDFAPSFIQLPAAPAAADGATSQQHQPQHQQQQSSSTKLLVCCSGDILRTFSTGPFQICFADVQQLHAHGHLRFPGVLRAQAELISPTVLRCMTPAPPILTSSTASYRLWVADSQGNQVTPVSEETFEFRAHITPAAAVAAAVPSQRMFETVQLGKRNNTQRFSPVPFMSSTARVPSLLINTTATGPGALPGASPGPLSVDRGPSDKENKIRIVEKLGFMKSALQQDGDHSPYHMESSATHSRQSSTDGGGGSGGGGGLGHSRNSSNHALSGTDLSEVDSPDEDGHAHQWLDDQQLSSLSHAELESLMDRYITAVVQQMVQLAALDDDLRAEIDSLDSSGFSLLHYCCLYSLASLVPVLINKGADADQRTLTGSTALHLAAAAGHMPIVRMLCDCNVDVLAVDANDLRASTVALHNGWSEVHDYLLEVEVKAENLENTTTGHPPRPPFRSPQRANSGAISNSSSSGGELTPRDAGTDGAVDGSGGIGGGDLPSSLSNKLLHVAFASLSLTDKCALSLSIGQMSSANAPATPTSSSTPSASSSVPNSAQKSSHLHSNSATSTPRGAADAIHKNISSSNTDASSMQHQPPMEARVHRSSSGGSGGGGGVLDEDMSEMHSVLSESDKESLDVAMSMMGQTELNQVEDEVRKIQNNVRGWLLRKNYTNLRDAAKVLQVAWREKKRVVVVTSTSSNTLNYMMQHNRNSSSSSNINNHHHHHRTGMMLSATPSTSSTGPNICGDSSRTDMPQCDTPTLHSSELAGRSLFAASDVLLVDVSQQREVHAAATLQAATRAMLARRRSFSSVRKQTMASLVIQKSLVKWWVCSKGGVSPPAPPPQYGNGEHSGGGAASTGVNTSALSVNISVSGGHISSGDRR